MKYLLDTCVVSEFVKPAPSADLVRWLQETDDLLMGLSVISIGEIQDGIARLPAGKRKAGLQRWLENALIPRFDNRILPVRTEDALRWGNLLGQARRKGRPLPQTDGLIAAIALNRGLTVVTRNTRDFDSMGVPAHNPWADG